MTTIGDDIKSRIDTDWSLAASINGTIANFTYVLHNSIGTNPQLLTPYYWTAKIFAGTPAGVLMVIHTFSERFQARYEDADTSFGVGSITIFGTTKALVDSVMTELIRIGRDYTSASLLRFDKPEILDFDNSGTYFYCMQGFTWDRVDAHA